MLCPSCSHEHYTSLAVPGSVYKCSRCGAIYGSVSKREDVFRVVAIDQPMLANCNPEDMQFFRIRFGANGITHGWMHSQTKQVVQYG